MKLNRDSSRILGLANKPMLFWNQQSTLASRDLQNISKFFKQAELRLQKWTSLAFEGFAEATFV
jgi:hypothetical protein